MLLAGGRRGGGNSSSKNMAEATKSQQSMHLHKSRGHKQYAGQAVPEGPECTAGYVS